MKFDKIIIKMFIGILSITFMTCIMALFAFVPEIIGFILIMFVSYLVGDVIFQTWLK